MEELPGAGVLGGVEQLLRRPLLHDHPVLHEDDLVGDRAGEPHLVRDDEHRHPLLGQLDHHREHLPDQLGVEGARRLVEQDQLGGHGERAGDGNPLLLSAGELRRVGVGLVRQADAGELLHRQLGRRILLHPLHLHRPEADVPQGSEVGEQVEVLKDEPHLGAQFVDVRLGVGHVLPIEEDPPLIRRGQPVDATEQSRLAGPGRADHHLRLSALERERDPLQHLFSSVSFVNVFDYKQAHTVPPPRASSPGMRSRRSSHPSDRFPA